MGAETQAKTKIPIVLGAMTFGKPGKFLFQNCNALELTLIKVSCKLEFTTLKMSLQ